MAGAVTLTLRSENAVRALARLRRDAPQRVARALNRAIVSTRTVMAPAIAKDMGLKSTVVRESMRVKEAHSDRFTASLEVSGARIPLIDFGARGPEPSRGRGKVTAKVQGGRKAYPGAFIATMSSGHRGVFLRSGASRLPIAELHGPSLPHVFDKYIPMGLARGEESLVKNLQSEFRFLLTQQAGA
jgi:hypothetical protein